jgi:hypothetical protein
MLVLSSILLFKILLFWNFRKFVLNCILRANFSFNIFSLVFYFSDKFSLLSFYLVLLLHSCPCCTYVCPFPWDTVSV